MTKNKKMNMKHAKQLLEIEIYRLEKYIKGGGIKDVRNEIIELKKELEIIKKK